MFEVTSVERFSLSYAVRHTDIHTNMQITIALQGWHHMITIVRGVSLIPILLVLLYRRQVAAAMMFWWVS